jgi:hypothetical protein
MSETIDYETIHKGIETILMGFETILIEAGKHMGDMPQDARMSIGLAGSMIQAARAGLSEDSGELGIFEAKKCIETLLGETKDVWIGLLANSQEMIMSAMMGGQ